MALSPRQEGKRMLYIVRAYEDAEVFEYEYALLEHAQEHLKIDRAAKIEIYQYEKGIEKLVETKE